MCGIVAYDGQFQALPIFAACLKNLEYCGYDSAGVDLQENGQVDVHKQAGEIDELELPESSPAQFGLGHTRWSTHGRPTDANAHQDCTGEVAVVHNGVVENFLEVKKELTGHRFTSETDTEVIAHLIEDALDGSLRGPGGTHYSLLSTNDRSNFGSVSVSAISDDANLRS